MHKEIMSLWQARSRRGGRLAPGRLTPYSSGYFLAGLCGHFLAATHRERGPISLPFTTRVAKSPRLSSGYFFIREDVYKPLAGLGPL